MGVIIQALTDGFRRAGIAHSAKGTYYPDGFFSEQQLEAFRREPQLVVMDQAESGRSIVLDDESSELLQDMGDTIAGLGHDVQVAQDARQNAEGELLAVLAQLDCLGDLILCDISKLPAADPAGEGVLSVSIQDIQGVVRRLIQQVINPGEAQVHASDSTSNGPAGGDEAPSNSAPLAPAPAAPATGQSVKDKGGKGGRAAAGVDKEAGK